MRQPEKSFTTEMSADLLLFVCRCVGSVKKMYFLPRRVLSIIIFSTNKMGVKINKTVWWDYYFSALTNLLKMSHRFITEHTTETDNKWKLMFGWTSKICLELGPWLKLRPLYGLTAEPSLWHWADFICWWRLWVEGKSPQLTFLLMI